jgi:hypothetical protein
MGEIVMTDLASPDPREEVRFFSDPEVTFTTEAAPGMHSAIIRAVELAR